MKTMYIILSFCVGLLLGYILFKSHCTHKEFEISTNLDKEKEQLQAINTLKIIYNRKFRILKDSLSGKLESQNKLLSKQKIALSKSQEHLNNLLFQLKSDSFPNRDTSVIYSLSFEIHNSQSQIDTLIITYEQKNKIYQAMVAVRDSELVILNNSYTSINDFSKEQLLREQQLTNDLNTALKSLRRKRIQNKILAGGMLFISGVATTLLIKSRQ
jgi:hypothetical protein